MFKINPINSADGAAKYFSKEDNYYLSEKDAKEASSWWGEGAGRLSLKGKVEHDALQNLLEGKLPNGVTIGLQKDGTVNHRPGFDLCFSAPKSISILALDGGDKRLYNAHVESVKETLKIIEKDAAQAKIYQNEEVGFENTGNLAVAMVGHTTSRKLDLQLHTHCLVMNATQREDGKWRALASSKTNSDVVNGFAERVYNNQIYYGVIYKSFLANKVTALGYEIETVGNHGLWEIKDVPKEAREVMSKRRTEIKERIDELNYRSLKAADVITLDTRDKKAKDINFGEIREIWRTELAGVGFSSKACIDAVAKRKETNPLQNDQTHIKENAKVAVQDAINYLSEYNLKLDYSKLAEKALEFTIGSTTHIDIIKALEESIKDKKLISLDKNESTFVTENLIKTEKAIFNLVEAGKSISGIDLKKQNVKSETGELAVRLLESRDRLSLVEHVGVDSKDLISNIFDLAESSGKTVRVLSPNLSMTHDVNENIRRKPNSLWQWLIAQNKPEVGSTVAGFNHEYEQATESSFNSWLRQSKDVVVVNASEMLGNKELHALLEVTDKSNAKVIFLNDVRAKQGRGAGNPMETLKQAGIEKHRLEAPERERSYVPELKEVKEDKERIDFLARHYVLKSDSERKNTLVLASSATQLKSTNEVIREELKSQGKIGRLEYSASVLNPVFLSKVDATLVAKYQKDMVVRVYKNGASSDWNISEIDKSKNTLLLNNGRQYKTWNPKENTEFRLFKSETLRLSEGDKITATAAMYDLGIKNGSKFTVEKIDSKSLELFDGNKTHKISTKDLENSHFDYNYATTLNRSSKKSFDHVIIDARAYTLDKATITSLQNRANESLTIFTNDAEKAQKRFGNTEIKLTAAETILQAGGIDRLMDNKTVFEIKSDIEKALSILGANIKETTAEKAVNFAIEKITSHNAGFKHELLVKEALVHALNEQSKSEGLADIHKNITEVIEAKQKTGELIMGQYFMDGTRWTTKEMLNLEHKIIADLGKGHDKLNPLLDSVKANTLLEDDSKLKLTSDQKNACHLITTSKDQFVMVQGFAGTGKTTMFSQVQGMLENTEMLALAPTHRAVKELASNGVKAQTLKSFLIEQKQGSTSYDNKLLVLDEASMISNKDFNTFLDLVGKSNAHVVLSGDSAQHISIEAGKPFEVIQRAGILQTAYLRDIVRQTNPVLKESVKNVISGDYGKAFKNIESIDPTQHIERVGNNPFFEKNKKSIIEIDNNRLNKGEMTLETCLAKDYLSRTPETRDKTVVIVHANEDRKTINHLIRNGLKEQGEVAKMGIEINCLTSKGLTNAEHKIASFYKVGDVVKIGKNYHHVIQNDSESKSILLQNETGKNKYFYPEKHAEKYNVELYEHSKNELAKGDTIRITKTDKDRERYTNFEYKVKDIVKESVILEHKETKAPLTLNSTDLKDAHWDYAHTVTGYGVQGASKTYAIDYEVSYRKNLANQRSFYIGASRAAEHLTIYTNDKNALLHRIISNKGDKYAALDIVGELPSKHNPQGFNENKETTGPKSYYDAKDVEAKLRNSAESFLEKLLGNPNKNLSSTNEWRYGNKGSLAIKMNGEKRGVWHNFETGESGNLLGLLQKETGLSFMDALKYAAESSKIEPVRSAERSEKVSQSANNKSGKILDYANQLIRESKSIKDTLAEKYLKNRGVENTEIADIRYHDNVYAGKNEQQKYLPALLSIGRDKDGKMQCLQVTYLDPKTGNKANIDTKKRTFASPSGAPIHLQNNPNKSKVSFIAEGVETGLSIKDAVKKDDVLVTLGKSNFIKVETQNLGQKVILCLDNDGNKTYTDNVIHKAAERLITAGKDVYIALPKQLNNAKTDFNDVAHFGGTKAVKSILDKAFSYIDFSKNISNQVSRSVAKNIKNNNNIGEIASKVANNIQQKNQEITKNIEQIKPKSMHKTEQNLVKTEREIY